MNVVVLDLEMNQPSGSVIQIGAVGYDLKKREVTSRFMTHVDCGEDLNPEIAELTGITQSDLSTAPNMRSALSKFVQWSSGMGKVWVAWGTDTDLILDSCKSYKVQVPKRIQSLDLKVMSRLMRSSLSGRSARSGGLVKTMLAFGLQFEGRQHDALTDAENTSRLLGEYVRRMAIFEVLKREMNDSN